MRKNDNRGMTLVEVVVVLAIFSLIMGVTASLILSGGELLTRGAELDTDKYIGDAAFSFVENRVKYATHLTVAKGQGTGTDDALYIEDGRLMYRCGLAEAYDVFGEDFYYKRSVALRVYEDGDDPDGSVILELSVLRNGDSEPSYTASAPVQLVNRDIDGSALSIGWTGADTTIYPSCALIFDGYTLMAGTYNDRTVNELSIRSEILARQYALLRTLYTQPGADTNAVLTRMRRLFESDGVTMSGTTPVPGDYARALCAGCENGAWPALRETQIAELNSLNNALYASIVGSGACVRAYCETNGDGTVGDTLYYAVKNGNSQWAASLVYDTRGDTWYAYAVSKPGGGFAAYDLSRLQSGTSCAAVLDAVRQQSGWIKLS